MRISFFKLPGHSIFDYQPRYYDAKKEEFEERVTQAKQEVGAIPASEHRRLTKGQMRRRVASNRLRKSKKNSNIRIIAIIGVLFLVAYYLLYT